MKKIWTRKINTDKKGTGKMSLFTGRWKRYSKKKKFIVITALILVITVGTAGTVIIYKNSARPVMAANTASVIEASAQTGSISNTIVGTGNLENDSAVSIKIPSGIVIDEVKVESGDMVSQGDVLATVDEASVYSTMEDIQDAIETLDEEINESKDDTTSEEVLSKVDGRVKNIYIAEDSDVSDVMLDKGALMLVSLDGKMAVEVQTSEAVAMDDDIVVTLSDGDEISGVVESVSGKTCVITMSDKSVSVDETVSVSTEDGASLGQGSAYIHQALEITGTTGTVEALSVSENEAISSGDTLYTLENDGTSPEYQEQTAMREAYTNTLKELIELSKTGTITADKDGTIESVLVSAGSESSTSQTSGSTGTSGTAGTSGSTGTSVSMSNMNYSSSGTSMTVYSDSSSNMLLNLSTAGTAAVSLENATAEDGTTGNGSTGDGGNGGNTVTDDTKLQLSISSSGTNGTQNLIIESPAKGKTPQTAITTDSSCYTGTISWNPQADAFAASTSYQAQVTLSAGEGFIFGTDSIQKLEVGILSGVTVSEDKKTLTFTVTFPETASEEKQNGDADTDKENGNTGSTVTDSSQSTGTQGSQSQATGTESTGTQSAGSASAGSQSVGSGSGSVMSAGSGSSSTGTSSQGASGSAASSDSASDSSGDTTSASEYDTDTTAFTISGNEQMKISVSVDELDINSVTNGQEAQVTFDALEDETFTGEVTKIGNTASVSGGVAKYTVEITVDKTEEMKVGMNASATIVIEQKDDAITIPVNALQERGQEVFVYTSKDEDGNLSGEQTVTTGLSDGDTVEITEGLSEGDTVYYQKTGSTSSTSDFGFGGGMMQDGNFDRSQMKSSEGAPSDMGSFPGM